MTADTWRLLAGATVVIMLGLGSLAFGGPSDVAVLAVHTDTGTTIVDPADGRTITEVDAQITSPDGQAAYWTAWTAGGTRLLADSTRTGQRLWSHELSGRWEARLSTDGGLVVLAEPGSGPYQPAARERTSIAVASGDQAEPVVYDLEGNYEPEAVARDGSSVIVIAYTPPTAPERYQVRRLDLETGEVTDVYTPDEQLQEEMGGTPRAQIASSDGSRLYTLYTAASAGEHRTAFVHVLDLDEMWAHCIVLPEGVAAGDVALALTPGGDRLYLADHGSARLVEIDTGRLTVTRTVPTPALTGVPILAAATDWIAVGSGDRVRFLDGETLAPTASWRTGGGPLVGLAAGRDELYAATTGALVAVAPDGSTSRELELEGAPAIRGVGTTSARLESTDILCAC